MARILGIEIPDKKRIGIALTYIYGIGEHASLQVLEKANIDPTKRTYTLDASELDAIRKALDGSGIQIEGDLRRLVSLNIKRLKDIKSYRGARHQKRLPARGQRTKTNSRTVRGNVRLSAGSGRKSASQKT